ncbi:MAG TPA: 4-alpha-glucanotransferase [Acidimicrobiales bacterium]|nr:4-alpha-glucanotransferase [Acidimicrobiales bacterium]
MGRARIAEERRRALEELARRRGVAVEFTSATGERRRASDDTLAAVLRALGEPLGGPGEAVALAAERRAERHRSRRAGTPALPPVLVAWGGRLPPLDLAGASHRDATAPTGAGGGLALVTEGADEPGILAARPDGAGRAVVEETLPYGVHRLVAGEEGPRSWVVSAPERPGDGDARPVARGWGVFAAAYSLRDGRRGPAGDLGALRALGEAVAPLGASVVATLPLLAELATADGAAPGQQPYAPVSRMWWNEAYLDLDRLVELAPEDRDWRAAAPEPERADLAGAASAARPALERAARRLLARDSERRRSFQAFRAARPDVASYARFRAAVERAGPDVSSWPSTWRAGRIGPDEVAPEAALRHVYAQYATDAQLAEDAGALGREGCGLLLDLPIGCRPGGYDPWAFPAAFAAGASVGAPPDGFFPSGQDWGFPPPHPGGDRATGYELMRQVLTHHLRHAAVLRVDHVLGWSRLWWVPAGMSPGEGAYVRYPLEELLAVACLEAWRHGAELLGEDLGTVERGLRPRLARHGVDRMRVAIYDLAERPRRALTPPAGTVAYVDTHDSATFAGFLDGSEVTLREELGLLPAAAAGGERAERARLAAALVERLERVGRLAPGEHKDVLAVLAAVLEELGESPADLVVVPVEDLLEERDPHNVPGTTCEHANFSRRMARTVAECTAEARVREALERLDAARRRAGAPARVGRTT